MFLKYSRTIYLLFIVATITDFPYSSSPFAPSSQTPTLTTLLPVSLGYTSCMYVLWLVSSSPPHPPPPEICQSCPIPGTKGGILLGVWTHGTNGQCSVACQWLELWAQLDIWGGTAPSPWGGAQFSGYSCGPRARVPGCRLPPCRLPAPWTWVGCFMSLGISSLTWDVGIMGLLMWFHWTEIRDYGLRDFCVL